MIDMIKRAAWRLGRRLYCWARGDLVNDPFRNGEYWLLSRYFDICGDGIVVFDVGANVGDWTDAALRTALAADKQIDQLYAFEPSALIREQLKKRVEECQHIEVCPLAVSSRGGNAKFYSSGVPSGTDSLSVISGAQYEQVDLTTIDDFIAEKGIIEVGLVKIDTEGFDLDVLMGARGALNNGRIELIQFEYNWRWLLNKNSLRDVFCLIMDTPYRFGKLERKSLSIFDEWHFEMDRFFENNYVLVREDSKLLDVAIRKCFDGRNVETRVTKLEEG